MLKSLILARTSTAKLAYLSVKRKRVLLTGTSVRQSLALIWSTSRTAYTSSMTKSLFDKISSFEKQRSLKAALLCSSLAELSPERGPVQSVAPADSVLLSSQLTTPSFLQFALSVDLLLGSTPKDCAQAAQLVVVAQRSASSIKRTIVNKKISKAFYGVWRSLKRFRNRIAGKGQLPLSRQTYSSRRLGCRSQAAASKLYRYFKKSKKASSLRQRSRTKRLDAKKLQHVAAFGRLINSEYFGGQYVDCYRNTCVSDSRSWLISRVVIKFSELVGRDALISISCIMLLFSSSPYALSGNSKLKISRLMSNTKYPLALFTSSRVPYKHCFLSLKSGVFII